MLANSKISSIYTLLVYLLFFYYFSAVYQLLCVIFGITGGLGLRESFYTTLLYMIPLLIFPKHAKTISALLGVVLWAGSLFSLGYFALYRQEFSQSVIFVIFETNSAEGIEFLKTFFVWWIIPAMFVYSWIGYFFWNKLPSSLSVDRIKRFIILPFLILFPFHTFLSHYFLKNQPLEEVLGMQMQNMMSATPWNIILGYVNYKNDLDALNKLLETNHKLAPIKQLKDKYQEENSTIVLVIGESTNRDRMSLYGYERATTPRLDALKNDLIIFDNVYSPRPYTIEVLEQALTFADQTHPNLYFSKPNLINIMKQAGYKTYWITNQLTQTKRNTLLTTFSKTCDKQIYLNNNRRQNSYSYDEKVFVPFNQIIHDHSIKKKFIVVHLLGTHFNYRYRYPENFSVFDNNEVKRNLTQEQKESYNAYDNAVYYNDYVVSSLIKTVSQIPEKSFLLYLSDHGEEVYDDPERTFLGRHEGEPTKAMYAVPFIVYCNKEWRKEINYTNLALHKSAIYSSSDLLYTMTDLAGLSFDEFDSTKSIVNPNYVPQNVYIGNPSKKTNLRNLVENPF